MRDDVVSSTIQLISETPAQQAYISQQLWQALEQDTADRQPLTQVATWCIGEYGDALLYSSDSPVKVGFNNNNQLLFIVHQFVNWDFVTELY